MGQPIVVENRAGAGGAIAAQALLGAAPDGYTLIWAISSMTAIPMLQKSPPYQSLSELTPLSIVGSLAFGMFVHPGVPATSVAEFVSYARGNPGKLSVATGTLGEYMATAQFLKATGISAVRVPYKGTAQLMPDLLGGRVQWNFAPLSGGLQHVKEGKLRMLAILLPKRSIIAPEVPTLEEAGVAGVSSPTWQAIFAPPRTPREIADRLTRELVAALHAPSLRTLLEQQGVQVDGSGPEALAVVIAQTEQTWRTFIREHDIPQE
jgi:tripartite-type tricarboxylate transporter receptor subunit TctC